MTETVQKKKYKVDKAKVIGNFAPAIGLVLVIIIFEIITGGKLLTSNNIKSMINNVVVTAICTIGAVFVFAAGYFDMSLGGSTALSAVVGAIAIVKSGSMIVGLIVCLAVAIVVGLIKGALAAYVNVPFFIFTIILGFIFSSLVTFIMAGSSMIMLDDSEYIVKSFNISEMTTLNFIVLAAFFILCLILFRYTSLGIRSRNTGGNIIAARQSGINVKGTTFAVFFVSAIGIALAAFLILARVRTVTNGTASTLGNDVIVALVVGGMPLSGGPRSKISAGIIGACTVTVLNSGLGILGLDAGWTQVCRGLVFVIVVFVSSFSYRSKLLPR